MTARDTGYYSLLILAVLAAAALAGLISIGLAILIQAAGQRYRRWRYIRSRLRAFPVIRRGEVRPAVPAIPFSRPLRR